MTTPKKIAFIVGDMAMTLTPNDIEAVHADWLKSHPGKTLRDLPPAEFSKALLARMKANARPTRTVIHN